MSPHLARCRQYSAVTVQQCNLSPSHTHCSLPSRSSPNRDSPVYRMRFMGDLDLNLTSDGALLYTTTLEALARRAISVDENDGAGGVGSSRRFGTAHNDRKLGLIARATGSSPHMGHTSSGIFGTASAHLGGTTAVQVSTQCASARPSSNLLCARGTDAVAHAWLGRHYRTTVLWRTTRPLCCSSDCVTCVSDSA